MHRWRKWINYEIDKAWKDGKTLLGIRINRLKDKDENTTAEGRNPFDHVSCETGPLSKLVECCTPSGTSSQEVYSAIQNNIERWIEYEARWREELDRALSDS